MAFIKGNLMPIAVGVAVGYFALPYLLSVVKNR